MHRTTPHRPPRCKTTWPRGSHCERGHEITPAMPMVSCRIEPAITTTSIGPRTTIELASAMGLRLSTSARSSDAAARVACSVRTEHAIQLLPTVAILVTGDRPLDRVPGPFERITRRVLRLFPSQTRGSAARLPVLTELRLNLVEQPTVILRVALIAHPVRRRVIIVDRTRAHIRS